LEGLIELEPRLAAFSGSHCSHRGDLKRLTDDLLEEHYTLPLLREALSFLAERPRPKDGILSASKEPWLAELERTISSIDPWTEEELNRVLRSFMKERKLKGKEFFHPLRLLLTGRESGAALTLVICVLGRGEVMERLVMNPS
jgi:lysyl-tRNA synthetase class I